MARGILATITAPTVAGNSAEEIRQVWLDAYADEPFVTVLPQGQWPSTGMTLGSNTAALQVTVDPNAGRVVVVCAIDNLVKGTAGTAIQCLNLAFGWEETTGLRSEEHTSELQSRGHIVCRLLLEKKKK